MCRRARPPCHTSSIRSRPRRRTSRPPLHHGFVLVDKEPAGVDRACVPTSFEERLSSEIAGEYVALAAHRCDPDVRVGDHAFKQVAVRVFGIERAEHHVVEPLPRRADVLLRHMIGARPGLVAAQQLVQGHVEILRPPDCPVPCGEPRQLIRILRVRMLRVGGVGRPSSAPMSTCRSPAVRAELTLSDSGRAPAADS